jgi:hypothetical protein
MDEKYLYDEVRAMPSEALCVALTDSVRRMTFTATEQYATEAARRIAALEAALAERERECEIQRSRAARYETEYAREHRAHSALLGMLAEVLPAGVEVREAIGGLKARAESAKAALAAARDECERLSFAIRWALGESDENFPPRPQGAGMYWWRTRLKDLAALRARAADPERAERVAVKLFELHGSLALSAKPWDKLSADVREVWMEEARAVLAAAEGKVKP